MAREVYNCEHGEINIITKEIWCKRFKEFCKHAEHCKIRYQGVKNEQSNNNKS